MSDDDRIPECDYCYDDRGICDRPHLQNGRFFTVNLEETFDVFMVRNDDKYSFVINHGLCFFASTCNFQKNISIRLVHPLPCKTVCLGEAQFPRDWEYEDEESSPQD